MICDLQRFFEGITPSKNDTLYKSIYYKVTYYQIGNLVSENPFTVVALMNFDIRNCYQ